MFPTGIILDCMCIMIGTTIGCLVRNRISDAIKNSMNTVFGFAAITIGIVSIIRMKSLSAVILALILGVLIGELLRLETHVRNFFKTILSKFHTHTNEEYLNFYLLVTITFCASGTNLFGAFQEGISGDYSILMTKAIMDIFAAAIFATNLGKEMHLILIPQFIILCLCFYFAKIIHPYISFDMLENFVGIGGILTFVLGLSIAQIKQTKVVNMLPALILIFPSSLLFAIIG